MSLAQKERCKLSVALLGDGYGWSMEVLNEISDEHKYMHERSLLIQNRFRSLAHLSSFILMI